VLGALGERLVHRPLAAGGRRGACGNWIRISHSTIGLCFTHSARRCAGPNSRPVFTLKPSGQLGVARAIANGPWKAQQSDAQPWYLCAAWTDTWCGAIQPPLSDRTRHLARQGHLRNL